MRHVNLFDTRFDYDPEDPDGYRGGMARVGKELGAQETAIKLFELPPGQSLCPYHYEYVEEWLLMLEGEVLVRVPEGEEPAGAGALVYFPSGPGGAHKLSNRGEEMARFLMFSSSREPAVAVYPDSDKMLVSPGREEDEVMLRRSDAHLDYYDGEV